MATVSTVAAFPTLPTGISNVPSVPAVVGFSAVPKVSAGAGDHVVVALLLLYVLK